jgi:urease accessory protein
MTMTMTMTTLLPDRTVARGTTLAVTPTDGRVHVRISTPGDPAAPGLRPVLLDSGARHARVALVPDGALLLTGDAVRVEIEVGRGIRLDLVEPAGTVAFDMRGGDASWDVRIDLARDATLVWAGEPFVVASGARVRRSTVVDMDLGARLLVRETLVMGRHGERGGHLEQVWSAYGHEGVPLLVEETILDDSSDRPGILGGNRALGTVVGLGVAVDPDQCPDGRMDLECGGTVWRGLAHEAHRAVLRDAWRAVLAACPQNS